jgi:hypothetical protein
LEDCSTCSTGSAEQPKFLGGAPWNQAFIFAFPWMHTTINVLDKPIERIRETMVGYDFERKLPQLETYLEGLVADGETDDSRLTVKGQEFLKKSSQNGALDLFIGGLIGD